LGSDQLNQASYCRVGFRGGVGELAAMDGRIREVAELPHLSDLRKLGSKTTDRCCGGRLNRQCWGGHGTALEDYRHVNLVGTKVDEHLSTIAAQGEIGRASGRG